jgi:hypothetical protein
MLNSMPVAWQQKHKLATSIIEWASTTLILSFNLNLPCLVHPTYEDSQLPTSHQYVPMHTTHYAAAGACSMSLDTSNEEMGAHQQANPNPKESITTNLSTT